MNNLYVLFQPIYSDIFFLIYIDKDFRKNIYFFVKKNEEVREHLLLLIFDTSKCLVVQYD